MHRLGKAVAEGARGDVDTGKDIADGMLFCGGDVGIDHGLLPGYPPYRTVSEEMVHCTVAEREDEAGSLLGPIQGDPFGPGGVVEFDVVAFGFGGFVDGLPCGFSGGELGEQAGDAGDHVGGLAGGVDDPCDLHGLAFEVGTGGGKIGVEEREATVMIAGLGGEGEDVADLADLFGEHAGGFERFDAEVEERTGAVGGLLGGGVEFKKD